MRRQILPSARPDAVSDDQDLGELVDGHDCGQPERADGRQRDQRHQDAARHDEVLCEHTARSASVGDRVR